MWVGLHQGRTIEAVELDVIICPPIGDDAKRNRHVRDGVL
jgi:hypothetical protein